MDPVYQVLRDPDPEAFPSEELRSEAAGFWNGVQEDLREIAERVES